MRLLVMVGALTSAALAIELSMVNDSKEKEATIVESKYSTVTALSTDQQEAGLHNLPLRSVFDGTPEGTDLQWVGQITVGTPPQTL
jgi:hypothetical protein